MKTNQLTLLVSSLISVLLGVLLIVIPGETLAQVLFIVFGILLIIFNILPFISTIKNLKYHTRVAYIQFFDSLLTIVIGVLLIFFQQTVSLIVGILLIVSAVVFIVLSKNNYKAAIIEELPSLILGILLIVFGAGAILDAILLILGWILIVLGVLSLIGFLLVLKK